MAKIIITCDECGAEREVDDKLAGSVLQCANCAASVRVPLPNISEGTVIGGFVLERQLGFGAMGEVWLARQTAMDRLVALKLLSREFSLDSHFVDRFLKEVRISAKMDHPNIITAFDAGCDKDIHYLAITYVDGCTLEDRIEKLGVLPEKEALGIIVEIAEALSYAWRQFSMLHRDIKPANIMIDENGGAKLMDMGISKIADESAGLTMTGTIIGTPYYMSPEQGMGESELDFHSDIYSLGATLYHMVTGVVPFDATTALGIVSKHITEPLPSPLDKNPNLSEACSALIEIMMAKGKDDRQSSWAEVVSDMRLVMAGKFPMSKPRPSPGDSLIMPAVHSQPTVALETEEPVLTESLATDIFAGGDAGENEDVQPSAKDKTSKTALIVVAAVVLFLGVVLAVFVLRPKGEDYSPRSDEKLFSAHDDKSEAPVDPFASPEDSERVTVPDKKVSRIVPLPPPRDEKTQRCENMWKFAKEYFEANPGNYDLAINNFQELSKYASGTKFKMMADLEISKLRKAKQTAVSAILADLKSKADVLAENGDFSKAVNIYRNYSGKLSEETRVDRERMASECETRGERIAEEKKRRCIEALRKRNDTMYEVVSNMLVGEWTHAKSILKNSGIENPNVRKLNGILDELSGVRKAFLKNLSSHVGDYVTINTAKRPKRVKIKRVKGGNVYYVEKKGKVVLQKKYPVSKISKEDIVRIAKLSEPAKLACDVAYSIKTGAYSDAYATLSASTGSLSKMLKLGVRELMAGKSLEIFLRRAGIPNVDLDNQEAVIEEIGNAVLSPLAVRKIKIIVVKYREKFADTRFLATHEPILKALERRVADQKGTAREGGNERDYEDPNRKVQNDQLDRGGDGAAKVDLSRFDPGSIRGPGDLREALWKVDHDYDHGGMFRFARNGNLVFVDLAECRGVNNNCLKLLKLFPDIKVLILAASGVTDLSPIKNLHLDALDISQCDVRDLSPLKEMKSLNTLLVNGTGVESLASLKGLSLKMIDISDTAITDIRPLARMPLKGLRMNNCRLRSYKVLRKLKKLNALEPPELWRKVPGKADNEHRPQYFPDFRRPPIDHRGGRKRNRRDNDDW